jgi:thiol-disulfide isomerase/thioredoxin
MLLGAFIVPAVRSVWWDFAADEFANYELDSIERPVFAVCTSPTCPHCRGIAESFRHFSTSVGPSSNVVFTHIDCATSEVCGQAGVRGVPAFLLIRTPNPQYWVTDYSRTFSDWSRFLRGQIGITAEEVTDLADPIERSLNGPSSFHLIAPKNQREIVKAFKRWSSFYRIFNCSFTFAFDSEAQWPTVTVYRSPICSKTFQVRSRTLKKLIEDNKFGDLHRYELEEWRQTSANGPFGLFVVSEALDGAARDNLSLFSSQKCNRMRFGWASFRRDEQIAELTSMSEADAPFLYLTNRNQSCSMVSGRVASPTVLENVIAGNCVDDGQSQVAVKESAQKLIVACVVFAVMLAGVGMLVAVQLCRRRLMEKQE